MSEQKQENRLKTFASFFKGYMGVMPLVTAALAPLLTLAKAIPVFESQKTSLATFSGLFGFLMVAWVFSARSAIMPVMANRLSRAVGRGDAKPRPVREFIIWISRYGLSAMATLSPLVLILLSAYCYISYSQHLDEIVQGIQVPIAASATASAIKPLTRNEILQTFGVDKPIPHVTTVQILYLGIFLCAEMAFVLMALREYGYSTLHISEEEVLAGALSKPTSAGRPLSDSTPIGQ